MVSRVAVLMSSQLGKRIFILIFMILVIMRIPAVSAGLPGEEPGETATKKILILSSYDSALPGGTTIIQSIRTTLRGYPVRAHFYQESLDSLRIPERRYGVLGRRETSISNLSPGAIVSFQDPSLWDRYRWYIVGVVSLCMIEALLIGLLLFNHARRRRAEVSSRKLARLAEEEHRRLSEVISEVPGIVWEARIQPGERFMKLQFVSSQTEKILGYTVEEFLSSPGFVQSIIYETDLEEYMRQRDAILASGRESTVQFRWRAKDGRLLWAEAHMTPIIDASDKKVVGMRGVTLDITNRKTAEEALRKSEQRSEDIVRALPDLVFLQSRDGTFLDCCTRESGDLFVPPDQFIGKNMRQILPRELAEEIFSCFERAEATGQPQVLEYVLPIQGEQRKFESRIFHTSGDQFLSVVRNVTERKRAEAQLIESEARFRNLADNAPVMIWVVGPDKLCTWVNKPWLDFVGRTLEQEVGNGWSESIHPDDFENCLRSYNNSFDARQPISLEYRVKRYDGQYCWMLDNGMPLYGPQGEFSGYVGSCVDITDRKRAEEDVKESQMQLAAIIGSAMDAIITIDENQRIILFNKAAEYMFGCSVAEVTGKPLNRFIPSLFRDDHQRQVDNYGATGVSRRRMGMIGTVFGVRQDGREFPIDASLSQTKLSGRTFYTVILRDITERLEAENALRDSEASYRAIFNGANDAIFIHDKETGDVLDVNQRMCDMYGFTAEEARTLSAGDLSANEPPYTEENARYLIDRATAGEPQVFEWRAKDKAGQHFWVEISLRGILLGGKQRLLAVVHDITKRKWADEALKDAFSQVSELKSQLEAENTYLQEEISLNHNFNEMIGESEALKNVFVKIEQVAPGNTTVFISGETGTGKELVARSIHALSNRKDKPLVKVNCATLPATLIESELFGHEKGAFTNATSRRLGRFELANGGTVFLDEIGELPPELQSKLLRVLQEGEFERVGSGRTIKVDVRIIAATNRDLPTEVSKGLFREDLWYRLNVFPINIPPLRERKEDILLLVDAFVRKFAKEQGKAIDTITPATRRALHEYSWPGNIRELANVIERAVISTSSNILRLADRFNLVEVNELLPARQTLEELERQYMLRVLEEVGWRVEGPKGAARILGLNASTLRTRMSKLGIERPRSASN